MLLSCGVGKDSWESLAWHRDQTSHSSRKLVLNIHWKDWCWSWRSNTLATWSEELTHWNRFWCWERLKAEEGGNRRWDGRMASPTQWTWVWENSGSWWWTGRPGVLQSMGSQRVRHNWETELNWITLSESLCKPWLLMSTSPTKFPPCIKIQAKHSSLGLSSSANPS